MTAAPQPPDVYRRRPVLEPPADLPGSRPCSRRVGRTLDHDDRQPLHVRILRPMGHPASDLPVYDWALEPAPGDPDPAYVRPLPDMPPRSPTGHP